MKLKALCALLVIATLGGCGALGAKTSQPLPTVVLGGNNATPQALSSVKSAGVTASGVVAPAQEAQLAFVLAEKVKAVQVAVGDRVTAGQALVELDGAALQAQAAQAKGALDAAQANYNLLAAGPTAEQLRQAEAALVMATAAYSRTVASAPQEDIAAAQAALDAAVDAYDRVRAGPQEADIALARANLRSAEEAVKQAQSGYDDAYRRNPSGISASPAALALEQATNAYDAAKALYDKAAQPADKAQLSAAYERVASARAALERARRPARDFDVAQARAQVDQARAQLDALKAGARVQQLDAARAQVASAQAQVQGAEAQLVKATLKAPFAGTVSRVDIHSGEWVIAGQPVVALADLSRLHVETTDLSERDVPQVAVGQAVTVLIKALNQQVAGRVSAIAPLANTLGGDVVYKATIDLDAPPAGVRAGMSVEVQFGAGR